ncbi:MAG: HipA N-terminal domain-containing protein [Aestuariibacter sp.]
MDNPVREGVVLANGRVAGHIREFRHDNRDTYAFQYTPEYLASGSPVGHAYPLQETAFESDALPPFFENLISEGWIRTHQSKQARLDKQDSFGLLLANGDDLIGALSVVTVERT